MAEGDWVVMPSKIQSGLYFGELKGSYHYEALGPDPHFHWREINWFSGLVPRSALPQDLLYSFGAFLTICKVRRTSPAAKRSSQASPAVCSSRSRPRAAINSRVTIEPMLQAERIRR